MAKKERYRGKGVRKAENSRVLDTSVLFSKLWEEVRERWLEVVCGHELVPFLVKRGEEGPGRGLELPIVGEIHLGVKNALF